MSPSASTYTIQIVNTALELLELVAEQEIQTDIAHLAVKVGMTHNKVFRLLATLSDKGLIERNDNSGCYHLGYNSVSLAQKMLRHSSVINLAHPVMETLARKHHEAVYMTVISGDDVLYLDMVDCEQQIKAISMVGNKYPFFSIAAGKVIKALESHELIEKLLSKNRGGHKNMPNMEKLASELMVIRSNGGVAIDCNGLGEGINSVAVAVKDYAGKVIGAITLLAPSFRMVQERMDNEIIPSLIEGAAQISGKFGYTPA